MDIKAQYKHSKFGTFMFNLCASWTKFIVKHKWLYYLLACTWGIILTFFGLLISGILFIGKLFKCNITFERYLWIYDIKVGPDYWGGLEMGLMFLRDQKSTINHINPHEFGHTIQQTLLGPLFIFIAFIPSATRYWYQTIREWKGKTNKPYDAFWAEDSATQCGKYVVKYLNNKK